MTAFDYCRQVVEAYRQSHAIEEPIWEMDKEAVYWQKKG